MGSSAQIRRIIAGFALWICAGAAWANCAPDRVDLRGDWGQARFTVEVADDPAERSRGLMHRETLAFSAGMLFVYEKPQFVSFWMKNTPLPLDMVFVDADGIVRRIHENAIPFDETTIEGGDGIRYVLEINGGLSQRLGITEGSEMRHPQIGPTPVWPCE